MYSVQRLPGWKQTALAKKSRPHQGHWRASDSDRLCAGQHCNHGGSFSELLAHFLYKKITDADG